MNQYVKKVLVTGATGFIGRHAIPHLLSQGYDVHVTTHAAPVTEFFTASVTSHSCDLLNATEVESVLKTVKPTHLLHFAWYVERNKYWTSPENLKWVGASLNLIRLFKESGGKRAVFAGTCTEYDWGCAELKENETPLRPSSLYGVSKNALQQIYTAYCEQEGVSAAWGRIFFQYGPGEEESRLIPSAIVSLLRGVPAEFTHGKQVRNYMHVEDVARAFVHVLESNFEGPINIASEQAHELRELINYVATVTGGGSWVRLGVKEARPNEPLVLKADASLLSNRLGFRPKFTLEAGLKDTVEWFRSGLA